MKPTVLHIDGYNLFLANFHACRDLDENGEPNGGMIGFLKQLKNLVYKLNPHKIIITFDGPNAGFRRRQLHKEYKGKRPAKVRSIGIDMGEEERKDYIKISNDNKQLSDLFEFLKRMPVNLLVVPYYEADDVIAYLVKKNKGWNNIIVSNDKDYLQLLEDNVKVYQFSKNILVTKENLEELYGVKKDNFLFY